MKCTHSGVYLGHSKVTRGVLISGVFFKGGFTVRIVREVYLCSQHGFLFVLLVSPLQLQKGRRDGKLGT